MPNPDDFKVTQRKQELEAKVEEVEDTLRKLREQLRSEEESAQHAAIERLEDFLGEIDNKYANLRDFWKVIRDEWRDLTSSHDDNGGEK